MKQVLQNARGGEVTVVDVLSPQLLPGCVLVRIAASLVSAGTERASSEFANIAPDHWLNDPEVGGGPDELWPL